MTKLKVAVVMGAESDLPVVKKAIDQLDALGVEREVRVLSAHRTPEEACKFAAGAKEAGFGVLICAAGKAAHLAGVMAGHTTLPVIGIPVKGSFLDGLDALLATVQMPAGIPVATVAVDGAANAAILAAQMLALSDPEREAEGPEGLLYRDGLLPYAFLAVASRRLCQTVLVGNLLSIFSTESISPNSTASSALI